MLIYGSSLKIKTVKILTPKYANTAGSIHFSPKRCLITLKKRILRSHMWPAELMHSKYRHKGRTSKHLPLAYFPFRHLGRAVPLPKKDVPDLDPDSDVHPQFFHFTKLA